MEIQDRDYMRKRPTRWDDRTGELRLEDDDTRSSSLDRTSRSTRSWVLGGAAVLTVVVAGGVWLYQRSAGVTPMRALERSEPEATPAAPVAPVAGNCLIKGNINSHGDRIYHVPGSASYDVTQIDAFRGERWFCTEDEARKAGWRAPRS